MDERPAETPAHPARRSRRPSLAMGGARYPIVSEDAASCLIEAPAGARIRGVADLYDGERHRAHCLVVLSRSEGRFLRVLYKRRTAVRSGPPADFATDPAGAATPGGERDPLRPDEAAHPAAPGPTGAGTAAPAGVPAMSPMALVGAALIAAAGLALVSAAPAARIPDRGPAAPSTLRRRA